METQKIKLSLLENSPDNVRRTMDKQAIIELKASISSIGMVQNIVVVEAGKKYQVVAGARRLKVLQELAEEGAIKKDELISCRVVDSADSVQISLAENIVREAMHPADEYEAYAALIEGGMTAEQVSIRFGCTAKHVTQRMRLGTVAPEIMKAFRAGDVDLDDMMAFTITADRKKQVSVFKSMKGHCSAWRIKEMLTEKMIGSGDPLAKFVGREAYEAAGGKFQGDLFSQRDTEYFVDGALLHKLADAKIDERYKKLVAAGWGFVERGTDNEEWSFCQKYETMSKEPKNADKPECGVYLFVNHQGQLTARMLKKRAGSSAKNSKPEGGGMSQALVDDLKTYRMEAFQASVASNTPVAITLACFCAALTIIDNGFFNGEDEEEQEDDYHEYFDKFSEIHFKPAMSSKVVVNEETTGKEVIGNIRGQLDMSWNKGKKTAKFAAFVQLPAYEQQKFLAYAFAQTIKGRLDDAFSTYTSAGLLAGVEVARIWRPTYDNYFKRVDMKTLDAIGKELFEKAWKSAKNKRKDAKFIADAVANPVKAANGDLRLQSKLETWLPSGMAFEAPTAFPDAKAKKAS